MRIMASLTVNGDSRRLQFRAPDGKRATIYLGKLPRRQCETVKSYVERLLIAAASGDNIDTDTAAWLAKINDELHGKLVKAGLVGQRRAVGGDMLGSFIDSYISGRSDIKPSTRCNLEQVKRNLLKFFGADRPLSLITPGDADEFRVFLLKRLADNTVRRNCGRAKQFFRAAVRKKLIRENPFADMKGCGVRENRRRDYFVTREEATKVIDACPDAQWRLLFALSRWGGLRCPSEHLGLCWSDVDWERNRFTVHSPKTEHHEGGESRQVPIFPELRPYLEAVWEQAEPGTEYVISRYRDKNSNLRTQFERIIRRAGLEPWPKPFQNCRATRATELVSEGWPEYKVCKWLGHSKLVASKSYWQVTDDDFNKASGATNEATYNTTYPTQVMAGQQQHRTATTAERGGEESDVSASGDSLLRSDAVPYANVFVDNDLCQAPRQGLEPWT